jgi:hypothetical protein
LNEKIGQITGIMQDVIEMAEEHELLGIGTPQSSDARDSFLDFLEDKLGQVYLGDRQWQSLPPTPLRENDDEYGL